MISITPADHTNFVAYVTGVNADLLSDAVIKTQLRSALANYQVLLFKNVNPDNEEHLAELASIFGNVEADPRENFGSEKNTRSVYVSNIKKDGQDIGFMGNGILGWHLDRTYMPHPPLAVLLAAKVVPPTGGDTYFADLYRAYEAMPVELLDRIKNLRLQASDISNSKQSSHMTMLKKSTQKVSHPVLAKHPVTGKNIVYYGGGYISRKNDISSVGFKPCFVGMSQQDSDTLSEEIFEYMFKPEFIYKHVWSAGDCIVWDNFSVIHRRDSWDNAYPRLLKRITIGL